MIDHGRWKFVAALGALLILPLMVILPVVMLFLASLRPYYHVPTMECVRLMSFKHYAYVFQNDRIYRVLVTIFMREFGLSLFLYTPATEPAGPLLYFLWLDGMTGPLGALGIVVSVGSVVLVTVAHKYSGVAGAT